MSRAHVPEELKQGPFSVADARAIGVTRAQLTGKSWIRLRHGQYVWRGLLSDPEILLQAALQRLSPMAAFSGLTAAWLHGLDVDLRRRVEVIVPNGSGISARAGVALVRRGLDAGDVVTVRGYRVTSICRTLLDLSWRLSLTEAVVLVGASLHGQLVDLSYLRSWIAIRRGLGGTARLRGAVEHAEPLAESPMETRLRILLVLNGLPRPLAQVEIANPGGQFAGRLDLYYPQARLGIEYDGAGHRDSLAEDNRRQNRLVRAGIRLLRFTAGDIQHRPDDVVAQVRTLLQARAA